MSYQPKFKKFALSALLLSAIAVPTAVGAAEKSPVPVVSTTNAVAVPAPFVSIMDSPNPLALAETYAPTTVKDWKKTLEQYNKITGNIEFEMIVASDITPAALVGDENQTIVDMVQAGIELDQVFETDFEAFEVGLIELSVANSAFTEAQISLNDAVKSKDTTAIKEALAELLVQYKQQIAEFELAE